MFLATQSTVMAIRCSIVYKNLDDRWPEYIKCIGNGSDGDWKKRVNREEHGQNKRHLLGRFNRTNVEVTDPRYQIKIFFTKKPNELGSFLDLPWGDYGRFFARIGNETKTIDVPMALGANGYAREDLLELTCTPPGGLRKRPKNLQTVQLKGQRYPFPPFNVTWYINGTIVGKSLNCTGPSCEAIIYYDNSSIPYHWNATILGDKIVVNTTEPICLQCRVSMHEKYGKNSLCTPGITDERVKHKNRWGVYGTALKLLLKSEKPDTDLSGTSNLSGAAVLAGSVMIVCAVAGVLYIITQIRKEKRYGPGSKLGQKIYKPLNTNPGRTTESSAA